VVTLCRLIGGDKIVSYLRLELFIITFTFVVYGDSHGVADWLACSLPALIEMLEVQLYVHYSTVYEQ